MPLSAIGKLFDPYERKARLYPGFLVAMPPALLFLCSEATSLSKAKAIVIFFLSAGGVYWLGANIRNLGKRSEERLFAKWGGKPTTIILRHADSTLDPISKQRYHDFFGSTAQIRMPNRDEELGSPKSADDSYRAAVAWLIEKTRDQAKFPLLFKENINYGFSRNMYGARYIGMAISALSLLFSLQHSKIIGWKMPFFDGQAISSIPSLALLAMAGMGIILLSWLFIVGEDFVKRAAYTYAERLMLSINNL
jgi:hypothetical protein